MARNTHLCIGGILEDESLPLLTPTDVVLCFLGARFIPNEAITDDLEAIAYVLVNILIQETKIRSYSYDELLSELQVRQFWFFHLFPEELPVNGDRSFFVFFAETSGKLRCIV